MLYGGPTDGSEDKAGAGLGQEDGPGGKTRPWQQPHGGQGGPRRKMPHLPLHSLIFQGSPPTGPTRKPDKQDPEQGGEGDRDLGAGRRVSRRRGEGISRRRVKEELRASSPCRHELLFIVTEHYWLESRATGWYGFVTILSINLVCQRDRLLG